MTIRKKGTGEQSPVEEPQPSVQSEIDRRDEAQHSSATLNVMLPGVLLPVLTTQMLKGLIVVEVPSGRVILSNEQVEAIWNRPFIATLEKPQHTQNEVSHSDVISYLPQDWPLLRSAMAGETVRDEEIDIVRADGTPGTLNVSSAPVFDGDARVVAAVVTFYDITERKQTMRALEEYAQLLTSLQHRLIAAQEDERKYIARELHDQVGQALTALKINLQVASAAPDLKRALVHLEESADMLDEALDKVRSLSLDIRPPMLDNLGLFSALRWYLDRTARRAGLEARFSAREMEEQVRFSPDVESACFRIAQEALTNVVRHARARRVEVDVELQKESGELRFVVRDDGVGFDAPAALAATIRGTSMGLLGMQERVQILGGRLAVESAPGQGTSIRAIFPVDVHNLHIRGGNAGSNAENELLGESVVWS